MLLDRNPSDEKHPKLLSDDSNHVHSTLKSGLWKGKCLESPSFSGFGRQ